MTNIGKFKIENISYKSDLNKSLNSLIEVEEYLNELDYEDMSCLIDLLKQD
jgi:hypothetical protein